jgi:hypothetical protein
VNTRTKLLTAGVATLALTGGIGASIASADTPSPAPSANPSSSTAPQAGKHAGKQAAKHARHQALANRALHGEATLGGPKKQRVVDFQRGTVSRVSATSITVKSPDGFTATYAVNAQTKVRKEKALAKIADVKAADHVRVVAVKSGSAVTAKAVRDRGAKR